MSLRTPMYTNLRYQISTSVIIYGRIWKSDFLLSSFLNFKFQHFQFSDLYAPDFYIKDFISITNIETVLIGFTSSVKGRYTAACDPLINKHCCLAPNSTLPSSLNGRRGVNLLPTKTIIIIISNHCVLAYYANNRKRSKICYQFNVENNWFFACMRNVNITAVIPPTMPDF